MKSDLTELWSDIMSNLVRNLVPPRLPRQAYATRRDRDPRVVAGGGATIIFTISGAGGAAPGNGIPTSPILPNEIVNHELTMCFSPPEIGKVFSQPKFYSLF